MLHLRRRRQVQNIVKNIQYHILTQPTSNLPQSFCGILPHCSLLLSQSLDNHVNDEL